MLLITLIIGIALLLTMPNSYGEDYKIEVIPNEFILKVDATEDNIDEVANEIEEDLEKRYKAEVEIIGIYKKLGMISLKIEQNAEIISAMSSKDIKYKLVDAMVPNMKVYTMQQTLPTGVDRIDVDKRLSIGTGITITGDVAILDTGIDLDHPDLNVGAGYNCINPLLPPDDDNGHGTHVAGIVGALDNSIGVVGVAPGVTLHPVKVLDSTGGGTVNDLLCGINWVTANASTLGIDAANLSLGGYCPLSDPLCSSIDSIFESAINNSVSAGVVYVVAAGNDAADASNYIPARYANVITVSAINDRDGTCKIDTFARFSNFGSVVDIAAPGVNILSTYPNGYAYASGTSMATPHVTGAVMLYKYANPTATVNEIRDGILANSLPQTWSCNISKGNGYGGFTGDPDTFAEPMLYVAGNTWVNDITTKTVGESVDCKGYTDLEHLVSSVTCELIDPSDNVVDSFTVTTPASAVSPPAGCGDAGNCIEFSNTFTYLIQLGHGRSEQLSMIAVII